MDVDSCDFSPTTTGWKNVCIFGSGEVSQRNLEAIVIKAGGGYVDDNNLHLAKACLMEKDKIPRVTHVRSSGK